MIELILVLAVFGLIAWLIVTYVPMPEPVRTVIIAIVVILLVLYVLRVVGVDLPLPARRV